ncbi:MAG: glycosyl hydrolase 108 family protein [Rhodospirillaceae bacterium]
MDRIDKIINDMIDHWEGVKYTNLPADRGGPTKFGITQKTLGEFTGAPASAAAVQSLDRTAAVTIYNTLYWDGPKIDLLPEELQPVVFDIAVNHGPGTAAHMLQDALNDLGQHVARDGHIGKITASLAAGLIKDRGANDVVNAVCDRRRKYYLDIIENDPTQEVHRHGWLRRCDSFRLGHTVIVRE